MLVLGGNAQNHGIDFFHGTWAEGMAKAKQENKKVFIDFFTEWCGPCLNMALKVFTLPEVGYEYNKNFVCMKIDAEKGEGIELAKRYGVHSYPSYIFPFKIQTKLDKSSIINFSYISLCQDVKRK